jgi:hypothetical protein
MKGTISRIESGDDEADGKYMRQTHLKRVYVADCPVPPGRDVRRVGRPTQKASAPDSNHEP